MNLLAVAGGVAIGASLVGTGVMIAEVKGLRSDLINVRNEISELQEETEAIKQDALETRKTVKHLEKVVLYRTTEKVSLSKKDMDCLAKNIFHEAGVEDRAGKIAIAQVTLNRVKDGRWGKSVCDVVYAKAQFSWTLQKKRRWAKPNGPLWDESVNVAHEFARGHRVKGIEQSVFYHTDYIEQPKWAREMKIVHKVGQHIFYKNS